MPSTTNHCVSLSHQRMFHATFFLECPLPVNPAAGQTARWQQRFHGLLLLRSQTLLQQRRSVRYFDLRRCVWTDAGKLIAIVAVGRGIISRAVSLAAMLAVARLNPVDDRHLPLHDHGKLGIRQRGDDDLTPLKGLILEKGRHLLLLPVCQIAEELDLCIQHVPHDRPPQELTNVAEKLVHHCVPYGQHAEMGKRLGDNGFLPVRHPLPAERRTLAQHLAVSVLIRDLDRALLH
mmetsp:Transcript_16249/g.48325  ORF Transcript_16249/g.48325 Transcript_16249/m.48325 type:complete len:234 (-) Transcript_16249:1207-1908(-)